MNGAKRLLAVASPTTKLFLPFTLAIAFCVRMLAAANQLWFDELCSVDLASQISGPLGVFTEFFYDNNHYLNTFWLHALGPNEAGWSYRIPSVLAGTATAAAVYWALRPWGVVAQRIGGLLIAFSYVHIHYSSEARGYALLVLFFVLAFGSLDRFHREGQSWYAALFGVFVSLAMLSHLMAVEAYFACGLWSLSFQLRQEISRRQQLSRLVICHALPVVVGAALYYVNVRHLAVGGGPRYNGFFVAISAWSLLLGAARPGLIRMLGGAVAIGLAACGILYCHRSDAARRDQSDAWRFFIVFLGLIPAIRVLIPSSLIYVRYFVLQLTFGVMLLAVLCAACIQYRPRLRGFVWVFLALIVSAHLVHLERLVVYGRGDYIAIAEMIADRSPTQTVRIASSNLVLDAPVLRYFQRQTRLSEKEMEVCDIDDRPDWLIVHRNMDCATEPMEIPPTKQINGETFCLRAVSCASYLSGFEWRCYQRVEATAHSASNAALPFEPQRKFGERSRGTSGRGLVKSRKR